MDKEINEKKLNIWMEKYEANLRKSYKTSPKIYMYDEADIPKVVSRMRTGFRFNNYNKDSIAIKWTCKELKINHTYKAIWQYLTEGFV